MTPEDPKKIIIHRDNSRKGSSFILQLHSLLTLQQVASAN